MANSYDFLDGEMLQRLQDRFCRANNMYLVCLGRDSGVITKNFGSDEEISYIHEIVDMDKHARLLTRLLDNQVEHVVEEHMDLPYIKVCGVSVPVNGKTEVTWVAIAIIEENLPIENDLPEGMMMTSENRFYRSIEFLETVSRQLVQIKVAELEAQAALEKSHESEQDLLVQLRHSEAMGNIVGALESEEGFVEIINDIMKTTVEYLDIAGAFLIQQRKQDFMIETVSSYEISAISKTIHCLNGTPSGGIPFFNGKPYMISSDTPLPASFSNFFAEMNWKASVFLPIDINNGPSMYLGIYETRDRIWTVDEIKFINDVRRVVQSILVRRIAMNSLASSYASLDSILEYVGCGIMVWDDKNKKALYTNKRLEAILEESTDSDAVYDILYKEFSCLQENRFSEVYLEQNDCWLDLSKTQIDWVDGRKVLLGTVYDITDKKRYQKKIEHQANNDFLTGLYNRMRCEQDLNEIIRKTKENGGEGAVLFMDLDDFKHINDGLGMQYGDVLLKAISKSLQEIPDLESACYRMGGDEFIIIVSGKSYDRLTEICEEIQTIFSKPWFLKGGDYYCTMSMGIVRFPSDGEIVEDLLQKADTALFEAKRHGKNRVCFYNDTDNASPRRLDMEKNMRDATQNSCDEFEVYYQPIIHLEKGEASCCGAEALIRWNSKNMGFMNPNDFIPLAEYLGLINSIGAFALNKAVKRCKYWNDMGHPDFKVNVNLSVVQLLQNDIVKEVKDVLEETRINPNNLTLEVTESLAVNDMKRMKEILGQIKDLGVRVALDDFGTGYSSLNHIREMPIDVIKIDRCFVEHVGEDDFSDAFVRMVSELAASIGMHVCVEGVETEQQLDVIRGMQIDLVQGYYYGKPMTEAEFEEKYI